MNDIPIIGSNKPSREWLRGKKILPAETKKEAPSGLDDKEIVGWDRFIDAFFKDHPRGLNARLMRGLEAFVLTWTWKGQGAHTIEIDTKGEGRDEDVQVVDCPGMPDFTYNRDGAKTIDQLFLPYGEWKNAVADLKLNLSGSSHGEEVGAHEHKHWGGPVNIDEEPIFLEDDASEIEKVFGL